jgi:hypothetical protein
VVGGHAQQVLLCPHCRCELGCVRGGWGGSSVFACRFGGRQGCPLSQVAWGVWMGRTRSTGTLPFGFCGCSVHSWTAQFIHRCTVVAPWGGWWCWRSFVVLRAGLVPLRCTMQSHLSLTTALSSLDSSILRFLGWFVCGVCGLPACVVCVVYLPVCLPVCLPVLPRRATQCG